MDWVKAYLSIWTELQAYIKEYHTTGLTWSKMVSIGACWCKMVAEGLGSSCHDECVELESTLGFFFAYAYLNFLVVVFPFLQGPIAAVVGSGSPAPAPCGGPPPPPPGPPPPPAPAPTSSSSDDSASRSALFAQINRGELITSGT